MSTSKSRTYDEVIFNRWGQPKGRIADEESAREAAKKDAERDEAERYSPISSRLIQVLQKRMKKHQLIKREGTKRRC
jgi:hypothetical protein